MSLKLGDFNVVCIFGAGRGIGFALLKKILEENRKCHVFATFRDTEKAKSLLTIQKEYPERLTIQKLDPMNEKELELLSREVLKVGKADLVVNSIGFLSDEKISPEKSLRSFDLNQFLEVVKINSGISALIAKYFSSCFTQRKLSAYIVLSAKLGSISDNKIGGWYSYRASKAALNMILKNISIEFLRKKIKCIVLSLHPGTTKTDLSKNFINRTNYKVHTPEKTAENILKILEGKEMSDSGKFFSWEGKEIPW